MMLQNGADLGSVGAVGQTEPTCLEEEPVQDPPAQDLHAADSVPQAVLEQKLTAHTPLTERERERALNTGLREGEREPYTLN